MTAAEKLQAVVVIAIDGPAGAGKSTVAKELARRLNFSFLDTGAMYRALTLKALRKKIPLDNEGELVKLAQKTVVDLREDKEEGLQVFLDGEDVSKEIRSPEVTNNTFYIARAPKVRAIAVGWQRAIGQKHSIVAEGRDIGTVVFPEAKYKFYLDADFEVRTKRRFEELKLQGKEVDLTALAKDLKERDHKDFTRSTGPLKRADDAVVIDSTGSTAQKVVEKILEYIK